MKETYRRQNISKYLLREYENHQTGEWRYKQNCIQQTSSSGGAHLTGRAAQNTLLLAGVGGDDHELMEMYFVSDNASDMSDYGD